MSHVSPVGLPYAGSIHGGLQKGMEIEIQGTVAQHGNGFAINLSQTPEVQPNTPLHFNVRFNENCVVLNSMENQGWGGEERKPIQGLEKGNTFNFRIKVKAHAFKIKVNGNHFVDFNHRLPKEMAKFLYIAGDLHVNYIKYHSKD